MLSNPAAAVYLGSKPYTGDKTTFSSIGSSSMLTDFPIDSEVRNDPRVSELYKISSVATDLVEVYFGLGCFWHMQHEFVMAEKNFLFRTDDELTSYAGYAGGRSG